MQSTSTTPPAVSPFNWNPDARDTAADAGSFTSLQGYFQPQQSFQEAIARLITLSGQDPTSQTDEYKTSVEFIGTYQGKVFSLYDYKGDDRLHIGTDGTLDLDAFRADLTRALDQVTPTPYRATRHYDEHDGTTHEWPAPGTPKCQDCGEPHSDAHSCEPLRASYPEPDHDPDEWEIDARMAERARQEGD